MYVFVCHIIEILYIKYDVIFRHHIYIYDICHDILQIGYYLVQKSRHSQSYDVSGPKVFFLWEASRWDPGGQASPGAGGFGRWNDVPPWVDGCCALDFDTNLLPKPIETLSGVCVWKSQTPVNCWLFEHIDHYRLWHMLVVCDSMRQYVMDLRYHWQNTLIFQSPHWLIPKINEDHFFKTYVGSVPCLTTVSLVACLFIFDSYLEL